MTIFEHVLTGCAPVPLAGYLKALGVFRLVAEQKDEDARGFWRDERFVLKTKLSKDDLVRFLVEDYAPTPVVSPWNKSSGYWSGDGENRRDVINSVMKMSGDRFIELKHSIDVALDVVRETGFNSLPDDTDLAQSVKQMVIKNLKYYASDKFAEWIDCAIICNNQLLFPPILGKGAIDARLDIGFIYLKLQVYLDKTSNNEIVSLCKSSLFSEKSLGMSNESLGQFDPAAAGGYNAGIGAESESHSNPFDLILTVEGTLLLAGGAIRKNAVGAASQASFPFMCRSLGLGSGATATADETGSNADFWAPLWSSPIGILELNHLFREGRAILNNKSVTNSLDFQCSVSLLGVDRGVNSFQRFGLYKRAGETHRATPLGRINVRENPRASLISELDAGGWLSRVRRAVRERTAPASLLALGRSLDEALFQVAGNGSSEAVQKALVAIGTLALQAGRRPKLWEALAPPPPLSAEWVMAAADDSAEFVLAEAMAGLDATAGTEKTAFRMGFRRHLVPLLPKNGRDAWSDTTGAKALAVWSGRDLVRDMAAVLERRLLEGQRRRFVDRQDQPELPLRGWRTAPLWAVTAFLADRTDDDRIAALAVGLAWAKSRPASAAASHERENAIPFAYAALKPLFDPKGAGPSDALRRLLDPLPLVRLVRAGRVPEAVKLAQRMARGTGLPAPFAMLDFAPTATPERLAAALLFPLAPKATEQLLKRAYSSTPEPQEKSDAA